MLSIQELRSSTEKELCLELQTARREMLRLSIGTKTKHLKNTSLVPNQKRYVAQILTVLNEIHRGIKPATTLEKAKEAEIKNEAKKETKKKPAVKKEVKKKSAVKKNQKI